jgi:hypothetical protein
MDTDSQSYVNFMHVVRRTHTDVFHMNNHSASLYPFKTLIKSKIGRAVAQRLDAGFPPRRPGFAYGQYVGFVVDKAPLGQVFSEYFGFPCQSFQRFLHYHNQYSPEQAWGKQRSTSVKIAISERHSNLGHLEHKDVDLAVTTAKVKNAWSYTSTHHTSCQCV